MMPVNTNPSEYELIIVDVTTLETPVLLDIQSISSVYVELTAKYNNIKTLLNMNQ